MKGELIMTTAIEKAIEIIGKTNDGDNLSPDHLYLVQLACNGHLNEAGEIAFTELYDEVSGGKYTQPWLMGVEHLTMDHSSYVYWKGQHVDHWSMHLPAPEGYWEQEARNTADRCLFLEDAGIEVSSGEVIWKWTDARANKFNRFMHARSLSDKRLYATANLLHRRMGRGGGSMYGIDRPTMRLTHPDLLECFEMLMREIGRREEKAESN